MDMAGASGSIKLKMELLTVGYESRTLPQLIRLLKEHEVTRLVDVRERPISRKKGFSAMALFEATRKAGITYETHQELGNPEDIRDKWKNGSISEGKKEYRALLRNGRRAHVQFLVGLTAIDRVAILCLEGDPDRCHRSIIAEEAVRLEPDLTVEHL